MLPKRSAYVKHFDEQIKCIYFLIKDDDLLNIILFGIKSLLILEKNLIANLPIIKNIWKPK